MKGMEDQQVLVASDQPVGLAVEGHILGPFCAHRTPPLGDAYSVRTSVGVKRGRHAFSEPTEYVIQDTLCCIGGE